MSGTKKSVGFETVQMVATSSVADPRNDKLDERHVQNLAESMSRFEGRFQIQPIVVNRALEVVDGRHRLEAAKIAGLRKVAVVIVGDAMDYLDRLILVETTVLSKKLSPYEIEDIWSRHYAPSILKRARQNQRKGIGENPESSTIKGGVTENFRNSNGPVNISVAAKRITGLSLETLRRVKELKSLAVRKDLPKGMTENIVRGLEALQRPGASVGRIYNAIKIEAETHRRDTVITRDYAKLGSAVEKLAEECVAVSLLLQPDFVERVAAETLLNDTNYQYFLGAKEALLEAVKALQSIESTNLLGPQRVAA